MKFPGHLAITVQNYASLEVPAFGHAYLIKWLFKN